MQLVFNEQAHFVRNVVKIPSRNHLVGLVVYTKYYTYIISCVLCSVCSSIWIRVSSAWNIPVACMYVVPINNDIYRSTIYLSISTYLFEKIERTSISFWNYRLPLLSQFFWWFFTRFVNVIKTFNLSVLLDKIESCRLVWTRKKESGLLCMLFDSIENVDYVQTFRQQQKIHQKMHHIFSINSKSFNFNE